MKKILNTIGFINDWLGKILSYLLLVLMTVIVYEVILRYFFNSPTLWVMEYSGYILCVYSLLGAGYTLLQKAHVNVDILYGTFHYRTKAIVDCFTYLLFFIFVGTVAYLGFELASEAFVSKEVSSTVLETPLFPIKAMVFLGAVFLFLQGIVKFIRDIETAVTGKEPEDMEEGGIFGK